MDRGNENGASVNRAGMLDLEDIAECFRPGGSVHRALGDTYEFREQQPLVAREVAAAFNEDATCLLEAPPGIGKTFAYLVPAARWALMNDDKVVISTRDINLQSQIVEKDVPMIRRMLGDELGDRLRVALVKGWDNYVCRLRAEDVRMRKQNNLFGDGNLARLLEWERTTEDGSKSDLTFKPSEEAWGQVSAESASCIRKDCRHYAQCFFFEARKRIPDAHMLVVNHDLLFSHLHYHDDRTTWGDPSILPLNHVVMDEGHNVVDTATRSFSAQISNHGIHKALRRLTGAVSHAATLAGTFEGRDKEALLAVRRTIAETGTRTLEEDARRFFNEVALHPWVRARMARACADGAEAFERRITAADEESWSGLFEACAALKTCMGDLLSRIDAAVSTLNQVEEGRRFAGVTAELTAAKRALAGHLEAVNLFAERGIDDEVVKSVHIGTQGRGSESFVELSLAPLDIVGRLTHMLYERCGAVIVTSATLRVGDTFDFQKRALGVAARERFRELAVPSPFDHNEQALLAIATDVPNPSRVGDYCGRLAEAVWVSVMAAGGGALVLFTARDALRKVSAILSPRLMEKGITPLTQGEQSREHILERFTSDTDSVLFATDSFREGVDVAGAALRLVVITKLPFRVPTEPVFEARAEAMARAGRDAFRHYAVPLAVLSFRQAFGRLIRTTTDRGAVVVLDGRLVGRSYGRCFTDAVPRCRTVQGSLETVQRAVEEFFRRSA